MGLDVSPMKPPPHSPAPARPRAPAQAPPPAPNPCPQHMPEMAIQFFCPIFYFGKRAILKRQKIGCRNWIGFWIGFWICFWIKNWIFLLDAFYGPIKSGQKNWMGSWGHRKIGRKKLDAIWGRTKIGRKNWMPFSGSRKLDGFFGCTSGLKCGRIGHRNRILQHATSYGLRVC